MRVLALDAALGRCSAAVVGDGQVVAICQADARRGHAALLPVMVEDVLAEARLEAGSLDLVAVTVGPEASPVSVPDWRWRTASRWRPACRSWA